MPPPHVARFSQKEMQALASCVRDGLTLKNTPRKSLEEALPGKPALVDAIMTAFQTPGTASGNRSPSLHYPLCHIHTQQHLHSNYTYGSLPSSIHMLRINRQCHLDAPAQGLLT